eukprot:TRINITY_DN905_c5_g1_i1.p1 TRINITY_DN905_c5_g1~~TRINITY_DN905_c5_g1_i1.p1  ORF type:complete len:305 (+),score=59.39 TRINITY_DN905_c5_g1_i1:39-917(+)
MAEKMTTSEMKELIKSAGMGSKLVGICEKEQLIQLANEALKKGPAPKGSLPPGSHQKKLSCWDCEIIMPKETPRNCIVIMHGFGATNSDFIPFARAFEEHLPRDTMWVFPQANPDPELGATAWWKINVPEWMSAVYAAKTGGTDTLASLIRKEHAGLPAARESGVKLVNDIMSQFGIANDKIHLSGFSQGAMTAMDIALSLPSPCGSVALFSGAPIVVEQWSEKLQSKKGMKVLVSHGESDPVLPFVGSQWLVDLIEKHGDTKVTYVKHSGGHDVGRPTMSLLPKFWSESLN